MNGCKFALDKASNVLLLFDVEETTDVLPRPRDNKLPGEAMSQAKSPSTPV